MHVHTTAETAAEVKLFLEVYQRMITGETVEYTHGPDEVFTTPGEVAIALANRLMASTIELNDNEQREYLVFTNG